MEALIALTGYFAASFLLVAIVTRLDSIPWRRSVGAHWTERARLLFPARGQAILIVWLVPAMAALTEGLCDESPVVPWLWTAMVSFLGSTLGVSFFEREYLGIPSFREWLRLASRTLAVRVITWGVVIFPAACMPEDFGWPAWALAVFVLAIRLWLAWRGGERLMRVLRILGPAPENLREIVVAAASRMGVSVPKVWLIDTPLSYAAANVVNQSLYFSPRLVAGLSDEELGAVCAHEIGHLTESRSAIAWRVIHSQWWFPVVFFRPIWARFGGLGIVLAGLGAWGLIRVFRRFSRQMEVRADRIAVEQQPNSGALARALERISRDNQTPLVWSSNLTHPQTYDRMLAAGLTPDYPRPKPPKKAFSWSMIVYGGFAYWFTRRLFGG